MVMVALVISCKQKEESKVAEKEWTTAEKIARAHGIDRWKEVSELHFTFNVERDTAHFERSWIWKPKTEEVTMISGKDTIAYNRKSMDSLAMNADKSFINDKYWLLAPFQLVWDSSATISEAGKVEAPISKSQLHKITITYPNDGGYTPGDAYDLFYGDDYLIKEWIYRKGNAQEPSLTTTWEGYKNMNGLKISTVHKRPDADWQLYFTDINVVD